jgi:hypothetical protein
MIRVRVASPTAHGCTCTIEYTTEVLRNRYPIRKYESTTLYCRPYVYGNRYEGTKVRKYFRTKVRTFEGTKVHTMIPSYGNTKVINTKVRKYESTLYESTTIYLRRHFRTNVHNLYTYTSVQHFYDASFPYFVQKRCIKSCKRPQDLRADTTGNVPMFVSV